MGLDVGGDTERGGVSDGDGVLVHSANCASGSQDAILVLAEVGAESIGSHSGRVLTNGLVREPAAVEGVGVVIDSGARMLNI